MAKRGTKLRLGTLLPIIVPAPVACAGVGRIAGKFPATESALAGR